MDWNPDRIITAPVAPAGAQDPDSDNAIIERFQEFFHEYPGPHNDYPYRTEIEERRNIMIINQNRNTHNFSSQKLLQSVFHSPHQCR